LLSEKLVGKSHVLRSLMQFAYQHGWADSTVVTSYQGRPVSNLRNFRGMTSCMLHQINTRANNSRRSNAISKTNLLSNFAKLVLDMTDECSLTSANACNKQAHRGLCNRDIFGSPFGRLHKILCMDQLQHTHVGGRPLRYGEANSLQQAYLAVRQRENAPAQHKLLKIVVGTSLFQQYTICSR